MMAHQHALFVILGCIFLGSYSAQASVFSCNTTSACGCSRYSAVINARIVGGEVAVSHSWGWAVSLRNRNGNSICGGTIISRYYVLTAAHCVEDYPNTPSFYSIVVGADRTDGREGQQRSLSRIVMHPNYNAASKENDIAILYLITPIDFSDTNVARVCLPNVISSERSRYPAVKKPIVAIGWGTTSSGGSASPALRQVTVQTVDKNDDTCKPTIRNANLQFCAAVRGGGKDTCQGDSGGPIMYYSQGERAWVLAGITSYGRGCGLRNYAGVYTRVSAYTEWIRSIVGNDGVVFIAQNNAHLSHVSSMILVTAMLFSIFVPIYNSFH